MTNKQKQEIKEIVLKLSDINTFDNGEKLYNYIDEMIKKAEIEAMYDQFNFLKQNPLTYKELIKKEGYKKAPAFPIAKQKD